jgi:hypothetical protein
MSEANGKEELMEDQETFVGDCAICDRKEVEVRHFETYAATAEGIRICLECEPPKKGGDGRRFPYLNPAAVSLGLAEAGFRGPIRERCLSMLIRWAQDRGLEWTVDQVLDDTGLTVIATADGAYGPPWLISLFWEKRGDPLECTLCSTRDELLFFPGTTGDSIVAYCDRCHLARRLNDNRCFRCQSRSGSLSFSPIEDSEFGVYLCTVCHNSAGRSPADSTGSPSSQG